MKTIWAKFPAIPSLLRRSLGALSVLTLAACPNPFAGKPKPITPPYSDGCDPVSATECVSDVVLSWDSKESRTLKNLALRLASNTETPVRLYQSSVAQSLYVTTTLLITPQDDGEFDADAVVDTFQRDLLAESKDLGKAQPSLVIPTVKYARASEVQVIVPLSTTELSVELFDATRVEGQELRLKKLTIEIPASLESSTTSLQLKNIKADLVLKGAGPGARINVHSLSGAFLANPLRAAYSLELNRIQGAVGIDLQDPTSGLEKRVTLDGNAITQFPFFRSGLEALW